MNAKQEKFCTEYVVDLNGTKAAIRAGYEAKSAHVTASRLLNNPEVMGKISELQKTLQEKTGITVERVLREYEKLAFSNMQDYIRVGENGLAYLDLSTLTRDQAAAIAHFDVDEDTVLGSDDDDDDEEDRPTVITRKVKIKLADKKGALDSIAKHLGMFLDKEQSPDQGAAKFAGTMEELLAMYRKLTQQHA